MGRFGSTVVALLASLALANGEVTAQNGRKLLWNDTLIDDVNAMTFGASRHLSQLPSDRFGWMIKPKPKLDCSMILQERQPYFIQNYHCRFKKPLVVPKSDGLTVQMSIAITQLYLEVVQRTNMLKDIQGRILVHESTDDGVRAGQYAFGTAKFVKHMFLPVEVVVMQPKQQVFDYLANKALHFEENDRLVLVQKGLEQTARTLQDEEWGMALDPVTGEPIEHVVTTNAVYASTVDHEICEADITAGEHAQARLAPNQMSKFLQRQKRLGQRNFCASGNIPLVLYIGEGTDYLAVLTGAATSLSSGKIQMVVFDLPAGFPMQSKKNLPKGHVRAQGSLAEIAEFFAPFPYTLYLLGNPIEPDMYNHQYYPAAIRIDKLFYSPLYDQYHNSETGATILALAEDDPFNRYMAYNRMIPCGEDCECDVEKFQCACAECKKLVAPLDKIPEFQKQLSSLSGLLKLRAHSGGSSKISGAVKRYAEKRDTALFKEAPGETKPGVQG